MKTGVGLIGLLLAATNLANLGLLTSVLDGSAIGVQRQRDDSVRLDLGFVGPFPGVSKPCKHKRLLVPELNAHGLFTCAAGNLLPFVEEVGKHQTALPLQ
jgi:hypothetical protein